MMSRFKVPSEQKLRTVPRGLSRTPSKQHCLGVIWHCVQSKKTEEETDGRGPGRPGKAASYGGGHWLTAAAHLCPCRQLTDRLCNPLTYIPPWGTPPWTGALLFVALDLCSPTFQFYDYQAFQLLQRLLTHLFFPPRLQGHELHISLSISSCDNMRLDLCAC